MPGYRVTVMVTQVLLVNKSGAICKFLLCVTATLPSMQPVTRFVLLPVAVVMNLVRWQPGLKTKKWISIVFW
ncbi:Uncharacterised protein [Kluyvera ascorbata]|nr:hypothetical protein STW0522KLE44_13980 [Klebsiella sp. STW0522-44]STW98054.1 Uncharacterised protein [Kluyvera ascorbata]